VKVEKMLETADHQVALVEETSQALMHQVVQKKNQHRKEKQEQKAEQI